MAFGVLVLLVLLIGCVLWWKSTCSRSSPPGPVSLPFIGHLHLMTRGPNAHTLFMKLARKYGPIMFLRFGSVPIVVASTNEAVKELVRKHDVTFASRPPSVFDRMLGDDQNFRVYGERWRQFRKLCNTELLSARMIQSFSNIRMDEVRLLLSSLLNSSRSGEVVDMREKFTVLAFNHICRMLLGKQYYGGFSKHREEAARFIQAIEEIFKISGAFPVGEFMPYLRWMDLGNLEQRVKAVSSVIDSIVGRIVTEHEAKQDGADFIDIMLRLREQGEPILQGRSFTFLLISLFSGGSETTSTTLEWVFAELIKNPACMTRLREEITETVGMNRLVNEEDLSKLPYLQAVVKESLRLHPTAPLLVPHYSSEPCKVMGYDIPNGCILFINAYAIGRDPILWEDPLKFRPERMLDSKLEFGGCNFELIPFGVGRRVCPGMNLALQFIYLTLANLVHAFNWKVPPGKEVDTTREKAGVTVLLAKKLETSLLVRLADNVILY